MVRGFSVKRCALSCYFHARKESKSLFMDFLLSIVIGS